MFRKHSIWTWKTFNVCATLLAAVQCTSRRALPLNSLDGDSYITITGIAEPIAINRWALEFLSCKHSFLLLFDIYKGALNSLLITPLVVFVWFGNYMWTPTLIVLSVVSTMKVYGIVDWTLNKISLFNFCGQTTNNNYRNYVHVHW